jgi:hypothetical protein
VSLRIQSTCFQYVAGEIEENIISGGEGVIVLARSETQKILGTFGKAISQFVPQTSTEIYFLARRSGLLESTDALAKKIVTGL